MACCRCCTGPVRASHTVPRVGLLPGPHAARRHQRVGVHDLLRGGVRLRGAGIFSALRIPSRRELGGICADAERYLDGGSRYPQWPRFGAVHLLSAAARQSTLLSGRGVAGSGLMGPLLPMDPSVPGLASRPPRTHDAAGRRGDVGDVHHLVLCHVAVGLRGSGAIAAVVARLDAHGERSVGPDLVLVFRPSARLLLAAAGVRDVLRHAAGACGRQAVLGHSGSRRVSALHRAVGAGGHPPPVRGSGDFERLQVAAWRPDVFRRRAELHDGVHAGGLSGVCGTGARRHGAVRLVAAAAVLRPRALSVCVLLCRPGAVFLWRYHRDHSTRR